ncbi:MAG: hypothetical protein AMXMBFR64_24870 [Myxococcales bacterium]
MHTRTHLLRLGTLCAALLLGGAAGARPLGEPWALVPWGDAGLSPGGGERQAVGPTALAASDGAVWIADAANERLLRVGQGGVEASIPLGFAPEDVRVAGTPFALAADLETVAFARPSGVQRVRAGLTEVRGLAVAPDGAAWVVDAQGHGAPILAPAADGSRAEPLGARHGVGRVDGPRQGRALLWEWNDPADLKRAPVVELPIRTDLPLGLVRPLRAHADGTVTVLLELLASTSPVAVTAEVRRMDAAGRVLDAVSFQVSGVAPANRYVDVEADGTLWIMQAREDGLALWRLAPGGAR